MNLHRDGDRVRYQTVRTGNPAAALNAEWQVGAPLPPSLPGTLPHFLTERYALSSVSRSGGISCGRIVHPQWPLREARLLRLDDGLVRAAGITVTGEPIVWHADELAVNAHSLERTDARQRPR
jgi:uncharacterized protein YqjF (DUF2071 family)